MRKKAIILDLDNTIYPVHSIADEVFGSLFEMIEGDGQHSNDMQKIKAEIMRRPFQQVAKDYHFSKELTRKGIEYLKHLTYTGTIKPFDDYELVKHLPVDKFLVTTGFVKLQQSKIERMHIVQDFKEIYIVDPSISDRTKKDVFAAIMEQSGYLKEELLVVGDDLDSEIKAAQELGIEVVLYDKLQRYKENVSVPKISDYHELTQLLP
jgi:putative hydrolase of the HAD superfamily